MSEQHPMSEREALAFAANLEQSIDDQIRCQHCGARTYPIAGTRTHHIRRCLSSSKHLTYIEKSPGQKIPIQWNSGPQDAA